MVAATRKHARGCAGLDNGRGCVAGCLWLLVEVQFDMAPTASESVRNAVRAVREIVRKATR